MFYDGLTSKQHRAGTHRLVSPEETVARAQALAPIMGITRVANVTGLDVIGIPVVMVVRPNSRSLSVTQGKGLTLSAAKASGLMEAIESWHSERIMLPLRQASPRDMLAHEAAIDPGSLPRVTAEPPHPERPLLWVQGRDLVCDEDLWVPYPVVHTAYTVQMSADTTGLYCCTTGLASGNHPCEAVSHGICEVVERDATLLWALAPPDEQHASKLDLATVGHPDCRLLLDRLDRAGIAVGVWETTRDIRIPSFRCTIVDRDENTGRRLGVFGGAGCHPTREIALIRALTEAVQSRLTGITGSRDDLLRHQLEASGGSQAVATQRCAIEREGLRDFLDVPSMDNDCFESDVRWELERLEDVGVERVLVVDLTRPEIEIPVVRVVIPGLESSLGPGECIPGPRARALMEVLH